MKGTIHVPRIADFGLSRMYTDNYISDGHEKLPVNLFCRIYKRTSIKSITTTNEI